MFRPLELLILPEYPVGTPHVVVDRIFTELLPAQGHRVHMIRPDRQAKVIETRAGSRGNGSLVCFPEDPPGSAAFNIRRAFRRRYWLSQALRAVPFANLDAILVRNDLQTAELAQRAARRQAVPFLFQISSPEPEFRARTPGGGMVANYARWRGRVDHRRRRRVAGASTAVLAISMAMRDYLVREDGLSPDRVFSFPMGISTPSETSRPNAIPADVLFRHTVIYVGAIDPRRDPGFMLDVISRVIRHVPDAGLLVLTYQQDDRRRRFEEEALRRSLPVRVVGPVRQRDVADWLRASRVLISPIVPRLEHWMSSPTKCIEALGVGLPVVGNAEIPEHVRALHDGGGGLVVPYSAEAFAESVVRLLSDQSEWRQKSESGLHWALAHRTYEHLARYLSSILVAVADGSPLRQVTHDSDLAQDERAAAPGNAGVGDR